MPTISLDYIDDIIDICKEGNLLITYYRNYDVGLERIEELFKYIDEHKSPDYNWVKIDVSNFQDECISHCIFPPCTVWYNNGLQITLFTSYDSGPIIVNRMRMFNEYERRIDERIDDGICYPAHAQELQTQEHVEVGDTWFWS